MNIVVNQKSKDDWRAGCILPGRDSDYEYRASGETRDEALRKLLNYIDNGWWDCELPKED